MSYSHSATSQNVARSIPDFAIGIIYLPNHTSRTVGLGLTKCLIEMGKGGRCVGLTTLPPSCADCLEI